MKIDQSAVEAELERILTSRCFRSRNVLRTFLSYIVRETVAGRQAEISQYNIAIHGLGKSADFTTGNINLIRVQAGRLRTQLLEYYTNEGRFNPIRIELLVGSYIPVFQHQTNTLPQALTAGEKPSLDQSLGPGIVCIPRNFTVDEAVGWAFITRLARDYVNALSRFSFCQVMLADEPHWLTPQLSATQTTSHPFDFIIFFDLHQHENGASHSLKCSLVYKLNQQIVWGHSFSLGDTYPDPTTCQQLFKHIAHDTVGGERGLAQNYWVRQLLDSGKPIASHHQIVVTACQFSWNMCHESFRHAVRTCKQRLEQYPEDVPALIQFAHLCRGEYLLKYHEIEPFVPQVAQTAEKLLKLAPDNAYSHVFHAFFDLLQDNHAACETALLQAQTLNPLDSYINSLTGLIYVGLGQWDKGAKFIQDCIAISPHYPDWYHAVLCIYHYQEGHYLAAMQEAKKIKFKHLWRPMLRTNLYHWGGKQEKGQQEYQHLIQEYPTYLEDSDRLTHNLPKSVKGVLQRMWSQVRDRSSGD